MPATCRAQLFQPFAQISIAGFNRRQPFSHPLILAAQPADFVHCLKSREVRYMLCAHGVSVVFASPSGA